MHNILPGHSYLCAVNTNYACGLRLPFCIMKKTTAFSSILFLGGFGSLSYLAAQLRDLDLTFSLNGEEACHYC